MKFPELLPPGDLLERVEGIESGLRQRHRLGVFGLLLATAQAIVLIANNNWFQALRSAEWMTLLLTHWPSLLILAGIVIALFFAAWSRYWIQESQEPFRYTYSIADFKPVLGDKGAGPQDDRLSFQMSHDLSDRLNQRIGRLSLLEDSTAEAPPGDAKQKNESGGDTHRRKSHIHIRGRYVIRMKPDDQWFVEVMPRVRIGPRNSPETLAHAVKFKLPSTRIVVPIDSSQLASANGAPPQLDARLYEQILERVYFSVATEIYKQIQQDVQRKIKLLPTTYLRAVALFHEAEDYARSTTLDAYDEALELYGQAIVDFDPSLKPWPQSRVRGAVRAGAEIVRAWRKRVRGKLVYSWPRFAKTGLMCARAEIGYANMLLYRQALAAISHQRVNPVFESRPVAERAVRRLDPEYLPSDLPQQKASLFDGHVTLALAYNYLGSSEKARAEVEKARRLNPLKSEEDARFLYVCGEVEPPGNAKLQLFQRAVEIDPRFDVAQFARAGQLEMLWRTRATLERNVAEIVFREYRQVTTTNPGIVGAWANQGYMRWLLGDADLARDAFASGRDYKEIKHETYVAELDYGLARIAAEHGDFEDAYQLYDSGVSALLSQGVSYSSGGNAVDFYHYDLINEAMMNRFTSYRRAVETNRALWTKDDEQDRDFGEVIDHLQNLCKNSAADCSDRTVALNGFASFLKRAGSRLTPAEREVLRVWAERQIADAELKAQVKAGDLGAIVNSLRAISVESQGGKVLEALFGSLRDPLFVQLVDKHKPARRIRETVYALVLDDYGNACYRYYLRSGRDSYLDKAKTAYEDALKHCPLTVLPYFHLFTYINSDKELLDRVNELEPNWPEALLSTARTYVNQFETKLSSSQTTKQEAQSFLEENRTRLAQKAAEAAAKANEAKLKHEEFESKLTEFATQAGNGSAVARPQVEQLEPQPLLNIRAGQEVTMPTKRLEPDLGGATANDKFDLWRVEELKALQSEANLLALEADKLNRERLEIENKVAESEAYLETFDQKLNEELDELEKTIATHVESMIQKLLPHEWLWETSEGSSFFDQNAMRDVNLRWEKEFNNLHARALLEWTRIQGRLNMRQWGAPQVSQTATQDSQTPAKDTEKFAKRAFVRKMLSHFEEHFWLEDYDLILIRRQLAQESDNSAEVAECNRKLQAISQAWFPYIPFAFLMWYLPDESFDNIRTTFYADNADTTGLSGRCYKLLGDGLLAAVGKPVTNGEPAGETPPAYDTEALKAYERAIETHDFDASVTLELAQRLESEPFQAWDKAVLLYRALADANETPFPAADVHVRIGRNLLAKGDGEALNEFAKAGQLFANDPTLQESWRTRIVSDSLTHVTSIDSYRMLKSWLEKEREHCLENSALCDAENALLTLSREKYRELGVDLEAPLAIPATPQFLLVTPIAVEAHEALFPKEPNWEASHPLFVNYIPEMRKRITQNSGITPPGVRLRGSADLPPNSYIVMLNEVPIVMGYVEPKRRFHSQPGGTNSEGTVFTFNPKTGRNDGLWKDEPEPGVHSWSYFEYIIHHLEAVLLANLNLFIGLQEITNLLTRWISEAPGEEAFRSKLMVRALPDLDAKLRFGKAVQSLAQERVPITNLPAILETFHAHDSNGKDTTEIAEAIRLAIKGELPGNDGSFEFIGLSADFETEVDLALSMSNRKLTFAIRPDPTQALLAAFRDATANRNQKLLTVVTNSSRVRPFVRRLLAYEFPDVCVLSAAELRPELKARISSPFHYDRVTKKP